jgi:hypothetical protein
MICFGCLHNKNQTFLILAASVVINIHYSPLCEYHFYSLCAYNVILITHALKLDNFNSKSRVLIVLIMTIYEDNIIIPAQFWQVFDGKGMDEWQLDYFL